MENKNQTTTTTTTTTVKTTTGPTLTKKINNEKLAPAFKTPGIFKILMAVIVFLIIIMLFIFFDFNLFSPGKQSKSQEELVQNVFILLFFSLVIIGICVLLLPNVKEFTQLFEQIGNVIYIILFTIFFILFYTLISTNILNNYSYIINTIMLCLGVFSFYKSTSSPNLGEKFNANYERIKMLILFFCLITLIITFYNINPGGDASKYFGFSLLISIIISVFAFLYIIILLTLPGKNKKAQTQPNFLSNFSPFGSYGTILFALFLVVMTAVISINKDAFFNNKSKSSAIIILLLIICILWTVLLGANTLSVAGNTSTPDTNMFKNSLLILFGLVISGLLIFWITSNVADLSGKSSIVSFVLNLLLIVLVVWIIYKIIYVTQPSSSNNKTQQPSVFVNAISKIISLMGDGFKSIATTDTSSLVMLFIAIGLIIGYFKMPSLFNFVSTQGGNQLVNKPVYTNTQYNLGGYQDLNGSDEFNYQYAISCWIFLDAVGPNMNATNNKYTSLLNFGDKPNVLYNGEKHSFMITVKQKNLHDVTNNKMTDFDSDGNRIIYTNNNLLLQKWNNLIINYNGGTLDIFLNGELVKSSIEVVPYYTFENLTIGENNGIKGGICNVIYFRHALNSQNIYYLYNTVKNRTPPLLNDSNETILAKNVNQTTASI
jgi:hypothetical protein